MNQVCTLADHYTNQLELDQGRALWRARLSNGEVVIQDDNRPGVVPHSAWLRLRQYVYSNNLDIERLWISFRGNALETILPDHADGYFFSNAAMGLLNTQATLHFMMLGSLQNGQLKVQQWHVPELLLVRVIERDPEQAGDCLILNRKIRNAKEQLVGT